MRFAQVVGGDEFHRVQQLAQLRRGVVRRDAAALVAEDRLARFQRDSRRAQPSSDRVPQVVHVQRAKALGCRLTYAFLVLGNRTLASVEPCGVVDAAERPAAEGEYRDGMLAAATLDDRARDRRIRCRGPNSGCCCRSSPRIRRKCVCSC